MCVFDRYLKKNTCIRSEFFFCTYMRTHSLLRFSFYLIKRFIFHRVIRLNLILFFTAAFDRAAYTIIPLGIQFFEQEERRIRCRS